MNKKYGQLINTFLIIVGGGMLIYSITGEERNKYLQIIGLVVIMFGLYRASNFWVENKEDEEDPTDQENS
tara:strand:+ start:31800 stop:32009 length:210 start_codon:yes stop_codon:yes gene_type:complete